MNIFLFLITNCLGAVVILSTVVLGRVISSVLGNLSSSIVDGIYSKEIADHLLNFLYFLSILFLVLGFFAVVFTFKFELEPNSSDEIFGKASKLESQEKESNITEKEGSNMSLLCEGFWSLTNLALSLFCFCGPCKFYFFNF